MRDTGGKAGCRRVCDQRFGQVEGHLRVVGPSAQTGPGSSNYPPKHPFQGAALMGGAESISQRESEKTALKSLDA